MAFNGIPSEFINENVSECFISFILLMKYNCVVLDAIREEGNAVVQAAADRWLWPASPASSNGMGFTTQRHG